MKKASLIIFSLVLAAAICLPAGRASASEDQLKFLTAPYWIVGNLADLPNVAAADGRLVDFYKEDADLDLGHYAQGTILGNKFILNGFNAWPVQLMVGETYKVATERRTDNYGANGTVKISGIGWDEVLNFSLVEGGGIAPPKVGPGGEPVPNIKLWFGAHVYQPVLVAKGSPFVVPGDTNVRADVSIDEPHSLASNINDYTITVDPDTAPMKLSLTASNISAQTFASGTAPSDGKVSSMSILYSFASAPLKEGPHTFVVTAPTSSTPPSVATYIATVEVLGGPLRLIGTPLTYPSPFRIAKDKTVYIQYTLSQSANIDLYLVGVGGMRTKKFVCNAGTEGGTAGINKVSWTGQSDMGTLAGNAIYVGSIISRDDGRMLGRFKLTIVD